MELQDVLVLIQTIICAVSLVVSLIALRTANKVKKKVENSDSHNKKSNRQIIIGSGNEQKIQK